MRGEKPNTPDVPADRTAATNADKVIGPLAMGEMVQPGYGVTEKPTGGELSTEEREREATVEKLFGKKILPEGISDESKRRILRRVVAVDEKLDKVIPNRRLVKNTAYYRSLTGRILRAQHRRGTDRRGHPGQL